MAKSKKILFIVLKNHKFDIDIRTDSIDGYFNIVKNNPEITKLLIETFQKK